MPKITLKLPFDQFRGTVMDQGGQTGQVIFDSPRTAFVSRSWLKPSQPNTDAQLACQAQLRDTAAAYKTLTSQQAQEWRDAADLLSRNNILGQNYTLTGFSLYLMVNYYRRLRGDPDTLIPPTPTWPSCPLSDISATVTELNPNTIEINFTENTPDIDLCFIRVTPPMPSAARLARKNELRAVFADDTYAQSFFNIEPGPSYCLLTYPGITWIEGDFIGLEIICFRSDGLPAPSYFNSHLAVTSSGSLPEPLSYWNFDQNDSSSYLTDLKSLHDFTLYLEEVLEETQTRSVLGKFGQATNFGNFSGQVNALSGGTDDYCFADGLGQDFPFTIAFWIALIAGDATYACDLITQGTSWIISVMPDNTIRIACHYPSACILYSASPLPINGEWHHVAFTYNGNHASPVFNCYLDGQFSSSYTTAFAGLDQNSEGIALNMLSQLGAWNLYLDELRIYSQALSSSQIALLYALNPNP